MGVDLGTVPHSGKRFSRCCPVCFTQVDHISAVGATPGLSQLAGSSMYDYGFCACFYHFTGSK